MAAGLLFLKRGGIKLRTVHWIKLYAPRWLFTISYPTRPRGIIVKYTGKLDRFSSASTYAVDSDLSSGKLRSQALSSNFEKSEPRNKVGPSFEQQG